MGSLQMMKPAVFSAFHNSRVVELDSEGHGKGFLRLRSRHRVFGVNDGGCRRRRVRYGNRVCCKVQEGDNKSSDSDGEPPESLFMKELRKRGISPASLLDEMNNGTFGNEIMEEGGNRSFSNRKSIAMGFDKSLTNQREQSMALNSEGLEGLIPRGKVLLRIGVTFFLAFWPLIVIAFAIFAALYLYFGPIFVHDGSKIPFAPPQYIDPYVLLQEERFSHLWWLREGGRVRATTGGGLKGGARGGGGGEGVLGMTESYRSYVAGTPNRSGGREVVLVVKVDEEERKKKQWMRIGK
ncbi:hypothetical protein KSS87_004706 [Heliosperma pusillum]|nr:hypothetical protein KSS87_004706 [Heliosperma pusillum]